MSLLTSLVAFCFTLSLSQENLEDPFGNIIPDDYRSVLSKRKLTDEDFAGVIGEDVEQYLPSEPFENQVDNGISYLDIRIPESVIAELTERDDALAKDPEYVSQQETFMEADKETGAEQQVQVAPEYWAKIADWVDTSGISSESSPCVIDEKTGECIGTLAEEPQEIREYQENSDALNPLDPRRLFVFPPDNRNEFVGSPITGIPPRYAGRLSFEDARGRQFSCSAVLIRRRCVLTAGHCVHGGRGGTWFRNIRFWPRQNRNDFSFSIGWRRIRTWSAWVFNSNWNYDMAMIELRTAPAIPAGIGSMAFGWSSGLRSGRFISTRGYPGDRPFRTMWDAPGSISATTTHQIRSTSSDVVPGNSGGMCYAWERIFGNWIPVTYGVWSHEARRRFLWWTRRWNAATRITSTKFRIIRDFCP